VGFKADNDFVALNEFGSHVLYKSLLQSMR